MNFNLDDPLGDILSDGSNDSFFETTIKKKSSPITMKKSTEDLFGIKDLTKTESKSPANQISSIPKKTFPETQTITPKVKPLTTGNISKADDDDIISDLGFDPKKPKSKSNILDDLLAPIETKKTPPIIQNRPMTASKMISRQSTDTTETSVPGTYAPSTRPKTAIGRKQSSTSTQDPLGLFSSTSVKDFQNDNKDIKETPKLKRKGVTADWLGIDTDNKSVKDSQISIDIPLRNAQIQSVIPSDSDPLTMPTFQQQHNTMQQIVTPNQGVLLMAKTNLETQSSLQALQNQEAQVMMASQMKNQEIALIELQKRQQDLLVQQETQFNDLLQKQINRQNQLEFSIRSQQERINSHIQLLMTQPAINLPIDNIDETKTKIKRKNSSHDNDDDEIQNDSVQLENNLKRLELEKLRLEDLIANINVNHEKELEFVNNSHKKQLQVLEENLTSIEVRLQSEIKSLESFYTKKLDDLENEKVKIMETFKAKFNTLEEDHEHAVKLLKLNYEDEIKCLKEDHKSMIETIRQSKLLEFSLVQDNSSYLQTLRMASNNLENVTGGLQSLRDEIAIKIDLEYKEKENALILREKKLEETERRLKMMEDSSEKEKSRLIELVTTLEIQLNKLANDSADEQWAIRQKLSSFEVERATLEREKEYTREQLKREEKRIEDLKQYQLEENQRLKQQIYDEQQMIIIERAKFETERKLKASCDIDKTKTEIETALKVAEDATRQADSERERFFKKQREIEAKKRDLLNQENEICSKSDELETAIISMKTKEKQIQDLLQKTRLAEQNIYAKSQILQNQIRQVAERESHLSQERLTLSKERLLLQEFKRKIELNKCSLCKIGEKSTEISNILTRNDLQFDRDHIVNDSNEQAMNYSSNFQFVENVNGNIIDKIFDNDISASLKRMENLSINFNNDFNSIELGTDLHQFESNSV